MMMDIFSAFDPFSFMSINKLTSVLLISNLTLVLAMQLVFWLLPSRMSVSMFIMKMIIHEQITRTYTMQLKGSGSMITPIFSSIILINLLGLIPYTFSLSSHLIFTLSLGLPMWMSFIMSTFVKAPKASFAHLLPDGAPDWLNPFLILIETTSIIVRPLTLSFRLAANMSAGHIVLGLINIYCAAAVFNALFPSLMLFSVSMGYILFEVAICLIQAYIFCLLLTLYTNDHAH